MTDRGLDMKLRYSPTSPYVRKVSVTAIETGLDSRIERVETNVWDPQTDIGGSNPLGKVPTLILDDGTVLFDSPVVCEYLDSLHDGLKLFPAAGDARWQALRLQALGDGVLDAAVHVVVEGRRDEALRSPGWIERQKTVIARALDFLEEDVEMLSGDLSIGLISVGCALGYLDLRMPDDPWRRDHPALADWFDTFSERTSMASTVPADPV